MQSKKIYTNDNCVGCNLCIANCPCDEANVAIMENGRNKIYIDPEKCIVCGECIRNCAHGARDYSDDTERFFADLQAGKQIAVIAAPAIRTNFESYANLLGFLRKAGASALFDTSFGADITTWAYLRYMTKSHASGLISQPCPAIVNYIERYTPALLQKLVPVHSPAMCTAIYMKKYKNIPGSYAFLSPCIAKQDEFFDPNTGGLVGYNITFQKLMDYLKRRGIDYRSAPADFFDNEQHGLGAVYPMPGGLKVNVEQYVDNAWIHQVEGQPHASHFLSEYAQGAGGTAPFLVDILNCQHGCNIGTGTLRGEDESLAVGRALHAAKAQIKSTLKKREKIPGPDFAKFDKELRLSDFSRAYQNKNIHPVPVTARDIEMAFMALHKSTPEQRRIDCRSCGYASCQKMAEAVAKKLNHVENCVEYFKSVLSDQRTQMEALALEREQQTLIMRAGVENILAAIGESTKQTDLTMQDVEGIGNQIDLMNDISARLSEHVSRLREEIDKYAKTSDEIVGISKQTNILALNASVEAARAGQFGKGFAVVAEQIKRLSDQSQQSAKGSLENNEVVLPLLRQVGNVSEEVRSESQVIASNVANILSAVTELARIQQQIAQSAQQINMGEGVATAERPLIAAGIHD